MIVSRQKLDPALNKDERIAALVRAAMRAPTGLRVKALRERLDGNGATEISADANLGVAEYRFEGGEKREIELEGPDAGRWYFFENEEIEPSANAKTQAKYREEQRKLGRRGRLYYLTDDEKQKVDEFVESIRKI
jgi:hypothetical protein